MSDYERDDEAKERRADICPAWRDGEHLYFPARAGTQWTKHMDVDRPIEAPHVVNAKVCKCGKTVEAT
jgi:hypothetical protein